MHRTNRLSILAALALLVAVTGTALATRAPAAVEPASQQGTDPDDPAAEADGDGVRHAVERLEAADISADEAVVTDLAAEYGVGGAVRILAWSSQTGVAVEEIQAMRADGQGWGVIARELGVHPGIGSIMGNAGGHGRENAPGQQRDRDDDEADD